MVDQSLVEEIPTVNSRIRICIRCGSIMVIVEGDIMSCKSCGKRFRIRSGVDGIHL